MKKLVAAAIATFFASSVNALHPNTAILSGSQTANGWYQQEDIEMKEQKQGVKGPKYRSPYGAFQFTYLPLTFLNAKWEGTQVYPFVICGYGPLKNVTGTNEPDVFCFAKTQRNEVELIEIVDEDWYKRYLNDEFPIGLTRGHHYESNQGSFYFKDVCDPYDGKKNNSCPTVQNLPGRGAQQP